MIQHLRSQKENLRSIEKNLLFKQMIRMMKLFNKCWMRTFIVIWNEHRLVSILLNRPQNKYEPFSEYQ